MCVCFDCHVSILLFLFQACRLSVMIVTSVSRDCLALDACLL